jgi:hypothetical protein
MNSHNMKNLFSINEEEKNRILNLHETATKRHYLSEQPIQSSGAYQADDSDIDPNLVDKYEQPQVGPQNLQDTSGTIIKQGGGNDPYVYAKFGNDYYYAKVSDGDNPNWVLAKKEKAINSIKSIIFNEKVPKVKTIIPPKKEDKKKEGGNKKPPIPKKEGVRQSNINKVYCSVKNGLITIGNYKNIKWVDYVKDWDILPKEIGIAKKSCPKKEENKKTNLVLSNSINPKFKSILDTSKLSTSKPVPIFSAGQPDCAQFVNDFDDSRTKILNAWIAHDVPDVGNTVWSSFTNLNSDQIDKVTDLWKDINSSDKKGTYKKDVKDLVNNIVPKTSGVSLKLNDVVGLYYPGSGHHEEAFYNDWSKKFFKKNMLGMTVSGDKIKNGTGWGMNTHVGIVGAIDNGVPIIFHNIGGQVWADPYNNLKGDSRIAWVKRA